NDGHSLLLSSVSEACVSYDCAWAFELSYVVRDALRRMYDASPEHPDGENIFYYLTVYNEPYPQPAEPSAYPGGQAELERAILRGLYLYAPSPGAPRDERPAPRAQILASGVTVREALRAQELLATDWGVSADVWSATSWTELRLE